MTIHDLIARIDDISEESVIYAKKINGKFESSSPIVLLELSDEDLELKTNVISEKYCPGFDYFLEGFMVKEMVSDMRVVPEYASVEKQVSRIIYYAEYDA